MKTFAKDVVQPVPCRGCDRLMFPPTSPYREQYICMGAVVAHTSHGYCGACRDRVRRRTKTPIGGEIRVYTHGATESTECVKCGRRLRPRGTNAEDRPGTLRSDCRAMCATCYRNRERHGRRTLQCSGSSTTPV